LSDAAPIAFTTARDTDDVAAALQDFLTLEAAGWKGRAGTAAASDPAIATFIRNAVAGLAAQGKARVDRMLSDGRAIAATITLASGDTAWCWKIAYDESLSRASPGVQLVCELTESLLAQDGPARVDSCAVADHPMIDHLWRERLALGDRLIALRPAAGRFTLACRMERTRRSAVALLKAMRNRI
jgi:hypothetical protein